MANSEASAEYFQIGFELLKLAADSQAVEAGQQALAALNLGNRSAAADLFADAQRFSGMSQSIDEIATDTLARLSSLGLLDLQIKEDESSPEKEAVLVIRLESQPVDLGPRGRGWRSQSLPSLDKVLVFTEDDLRLWRGFDDREEGMKGSEIAEVFRGRGAADSVRLLNDKFERVQLPKVIIYQRKQSGEGFFVRDLNVTIEGIPDEVQFKPTSEISGQSPTSASFFCPEEVGGETPEIGLGEKNQAGGAGNF